MPSTPCFVQCLSPFRASLYLLMGSSQALRRQVTEMAFVPSPLPHTFAQGHLNDKCAPRPHVWASQSALLLVELGHPH